jgi:D-alanine--D-alanine ligase
MRTPAEIQTAFANRNVLDASRRIFLVGIGGAGMSGLARLAQRRDLEVAGTDSTASEETDRLQSESISVWIGHSGQAVRDFRPDVMVLSDAIPLDISPEVEAARELGVPLLRRSQLLGWLLKGMRTIAITGTHGKTTTTGMIGAGLTAAGLDPLVIVGANIPAWGGPILYGDGNWAVVEACEAYDSFHDLDPEIAVVTNLEPDHLDFHGNWERLRDSVQRFVNRAKTDLIVPVEDKGATDLVENWPGEEASLITVGDLYDVPHLVLPGHHNRVNANLARAACAVALLEDRVDGSVDARMERAVEGIRTFTGAERRLQVIDESDITVISDYAHHPTEIDASINALRERYPDRRLVVVFQPHLYSRTREHLGEFARALSRSDVLFITDIYPAREDPIPGVSSALIAERASTETYYVPSRHLLPRRVGKFVREGDVVVGMGAGTIGDFPRQLVTERSRRERGHLKIAVFYGGDSSEREVSLHSARAVVEALRSRGHEVTEIDAAELLLQSGSVKALIGADRPDVCFLAVHGTNQEDGAMQGLCELLHLPYTGSGILASALAMDKAKAKRALADAGLPVPNGYQLRRTDQTQIPAGEYVVKPNANGSTVGVSFVSDSEGLRDAVERAFHYDDTVLVEERLRGMEVSVPVLSDQSLPTIEIVPASGDYDFSNKYTPGATAEIIPARLPADVYAETQRLALAAHRALGCSGATRTDMIIDEKRGPVILEVNTLPGLTGTSLLPNSAAAAGIDFPDLCERIVRDALDRAEASG